MDTQPSPRVSTLHTRFHRFLQTVLMPQETAINAALRGSQDGGAATLAQSLLGAMRQKAQIAGLWTLYLPLSTRSSHGLNHWEYAPIIESLGAVAWAAEVFNSAQPDAGNIVSLDQYASEAMKDRWLDPLLRGDIRSAWAAAEPDAMLSRPETLRTQAVRDGHHWVIDGRKTWVQGLDDPRCEVLLVLARTDAQAPLHRQFSVLLVPRQTDGMQRGRQMHGWGPPGSGWCELTLQQVRVPADHLVGAGGDGLDVLRQRQSTVALHEALWCLGAAERSLALMLQRLQTRRMGEDSAARHPLWQERVAHARCGLDTTRMLARRIAWTLDQDPDSPPLQQLAMLQSLALPLAVDVVQWAILAFEADALDSSLPLAGLSAQLRVMQDIAPPLSSLHASIAQAELQRGY